VQNVPGKLPGKLFLPRELLGTAIVHPPSGFSKGNLVKIARLIGAAGSGKTTELLKIMEAALPKLGGNPLRLGFASFTRAARAEAVGRAAAAWNVAPSMLDGEGWFRTVHSTARRCLGLEPGQLIGNSAADTEWISNALGVKVSTSIDDDTGRQKFVGGQEGAALTCWERARNTLQPLDEVVRKMRRLDDDVPDYAAVVRISERYEMAKRLGDRLDFSDLLLRFSGFRLHTVDGIARTEPEGELPDVSAWLFDEQQDASPLLDAACKRLVAAESVKWCYVVGDPFQSIFGFAGSSAECFLGWPAEKERTMPKSYRCPKPILELGERCLRRMHRGYFDRKVAPADHEGRIFDCETELPFIRARPDEEWLFIARTNYEANRLYASLHAAGKPAKWVTQQEGATARGTGLAALYALEIGQHVSGSEWARAIELLPCTNKDKEPMLDRGVKTGWAKKHSDEWDVIFPDDLQKVGATEPLVEKIRSGRWCGLVDRGEEWRRHAERWGPKLVAETKIRVGTIHSVKGMEADNVALLTTVGKRVEQGREDCQDQHDEECRIAYVGVTRARRNLYVVNEGRHGKPVPRMEVL
jgi:DNA helicase-2/ATP-dependent DNA helicase PcrA